MTKIVRDDRARQGPPGRPVLVVLVSALILCGIAIGGYLVWVTTTSPRSPTQDASRESVTGSPTGTGSVTPQATPPANPNSATPPTPQRPQPITPQPAQ